jgi:hypothetical protein
MSLAAVPAYLLARRLLPMPLSLAAAVLAVAVPSMLFTGTVMTENVFYPLFLTGALVLVLVLERPTWGRQLTLFALIGLLFATRAQSVAFAPAIVVAPILLALFGRQPLRATLVRFRVLYELLIGGAILVLAAQLVRGRSPSDLLGAYSIVGDRSYDVGTVCRFFVSTWQSSTCISVSSRLRPFVLLAVIARRSAPRSPPSSPRAPR